MAIISTVYDHDLYFTVEVIITAANKTIIKPDTCLPAAVFNCVQCPQLNTHIQADHVKTNEMHGQLFWR